MTIGTIEKGRVRLTPFTERYLTPEYVSWLNDKQLTRYSEQRHRLHTLESCRTYMLGFLGTAHHFWAIEATDRDGLHIGNLNAYVDEHNGLADLGILIGHAAAQRQGYGLEAWKAALGYLAALPGLRKLTAGMLSNNARMVALAQKTGMVEDGRRKNHYLWEGCAMDVIHMALFTSPSGGAFLHG